MSGPPDDGALAAAIFDLDGLLIDSEPLWQDAEMEVFADIGLVLSRDDCRRTTGLRTEKVVEFWLQRRGWETDRFPVVQLTERINRRVIELIGLRGAAKAGVDHALDAVEAWGLRIALASSSGMEVIDVALRRLRIEHRFEVVHSADSERRSKPFPDVYLGAAARLGVEPRRCVALEDSIPGVAAAKAAGMLCVRVPEHDGPASEADLELRSLTQLDDDARNLLLSLSTFPHASRPG